MSVHRCSICGCSESLSPRHRASHNIHGSGGTESSLFRPHGFRIPTFHYTLEMFLSSSNSRSGGYMSVPKECSSELELNLVPTYSRRTSLRQLCISLLLVVIGGLLGFIAGWKTANSTLGPFGT